MPQGVYARPKSEPVPCSASEGCNRVAEHPVSGLCHKHYARWKRTGTTDLEPRWPEDVDGQRQCTKCDIWKPLDRYRPAYNTEGRTRMRYCRDCEAAQILAWQKANPDKKRQLERVGKARRRYGQAGLQILERIDAGEGCEVCGGRTTKMAIDHCHLTDMVRGLLCSNCNTALGLLGEDEDRIRALLSYMLRHHQDREDRMNGDIYIADVT